MELNSFVFPSPKCTWTVEDYPNMMIFIPKNLKKLQKMTSTKKLTTGSFTSAFSRQPLTSCENNSNLPQDILKYRPKDDLKELNTKDRATLRSLDKYSSIIGKKTSKNMSRRTKTLINELDNNLWQAAAVLKVARESHRPRIATTRAPIKGMPKSNTFRNMPKLYMNNVPRAF